MRFTHLAPVSRDHITHTGYYPLPSHFGGDSYQFNIKPIERHEVFRVLFCAPPGSLGISYISKSMLRWEETMVSGLQNAITEGYIQLVGFPEELPGMFWSDSAGDGKLVYQGPKPMKDEDRAKEFALSYRWAMYE